MAYSLQRTTTKLLGEVRFPVRYPPTAVEISPTEVSAVRLRRDRSGRRLLGYGVAPVSGPVPSLVTLTAKGHGLDELREAVSRAVDSAGIRSGKASLLIPDSLARVWLLQLPEIPAGREQMLEMIRWKIKRTVPFRIEDGAIAWQVLSYPTGTQPAVVLAGLIPRPLVLHYEGLMAALGLKVGLVDLSSFNLFNAYRHTIAANGGSAGDFGLLNATESYFTLMLFREGELVFFRCKTHADAEGSVPEERQRTFRREMATSMSYYMERLKG